MYDLHKLGWNSFQQLCLTILREILGQTVESFLDSHDGGRDGGFAGKWNVEGQEDLSGPFVVQCKHTSKSNYVLKESDISDEVEKVKRLVARGQCDTYILLTNAGLTGDTESKISKHFRDAGVKYFRAYGSTWFNQQIRENKRLRMLVPRVYGLGDLTQILDERAYSQARNIIESMRDEFAKVVVTDAYRKASEAMDRRGFVLLLGEPASGKTTIASLLAITALDQWGASVLKLDDPQNVVEHWNPDEPSQFFWIDDAFGVTQYEDHLVYGWNHNIAQINAMLRHGAKIVMTSRDYIYNSARHDLKTGSFPLLNESQVVIDVHELTSDEKRQILYNHMKLGQQPRIFRSRIKPFLESVANHPRFIPEIARRLGTPFFTKGLKIGKLELEAFVERREQLLLEVIDGLDTDSRAALALIFIRKGRLQSPIQLDESEKVGLGRLGSDEGKCIAALENLKGSLVRLSRESGDSIWQFTHPTIGDAYAEYLAQNPEHIGIFVKGSAPEQLINQVTCGDVGIRNAVVLPSSLFSEMLEKLEELYQSNLHKSVRRSKYEAKGMLYGFLARRCTEEFLTLYLQHNPSILDEVSQPGLFLSAVSEARLAKRFHQFGLLPEKHRGKFVQTVSKYAIEGEDVSALDDEELKGFFTDEEFSKMAEDIKDDLLPRLSEARDHWDSNYTSDELPEDYIQPWLEILHTLERYFEDDDEATSSIKYEISSTHNWIQETEEWVVDRYYEPDGDDLDSWYIRDSESPESVLSTRGMFDDVDVV